MDVEELRHQIYQFNDEELFYKEHMKPGKPGDLCLYRKTGDSGGYPPPLTDSGSERNHFHRNLKTLSF